MPIYIIEHLEPKVYPWCLIEYKNISKIVGKGNLWFTNIKRKNKDLEKIGKVFKESIRDIKLKSSDICILDPEAKTLLNPKDSKKFRYYIFGGILGDYPPKKRTKEELSRFLKGEKRNIGKKQFSTDNAVLVTKRIIEEKIPLNKMKFVEPLIIEINDIESIELPFAYPVINGKPQISKDLLRYLKKKKSF